MNECSNPPDAIRLTSEITVEYVDHMGSDAAIAHAAWVSPKSRRHHPGNTGLDPKGQVVTADRLRGIIGTLMSKRHGTPFEHGALTITVHAPIFVWREWHRHRIAWSYNEESARYKELEPVFYAPPPDRPMIRPPGFKSMSPSFDRAEAEEYAGIVDDLRDGYEFAYRTYRNLLGRGADRGLARDVLGVGIYSSCYCTANPRSLMSFLELRTDEPTAKRPSKPLYEIEVAARKVEAIFARLWPVTYEAWINNGRMAP